MAEYGQGMVRPGVWSSPEWAPGYVDRQRVIAKTLQALHTDIASYWAHHTMKSVEDWAKLRVMFVNTSADFQAQWMTATQVPMDVATEILSRPLPPPCQLCERVGPHTHHERWSDDG